MNPLIAGYIWHEDPFALSLVLPPVGDLEPHLRGQQFLGGSVSDEWFVCYLLVTITSAFSG